MTLPFRLLSALLFCAVGFTACSADTDISLAALVDRIEALEVQGKHQHAVITEQNQKIAQQDMKIKELMDWKEQQLYDKHDNPSHTMDIHRPDDPSLHDRPENSKIQSDDPNSTDYSEEAGVIPQYQKLGYKNTRGIKRAIADTKSSRNTEARRALVDPEGPVAFQAVMNGGDFPNLGSKQNVVFNQVNINLGGGYHNLHGVFITPSPGVYIFSTSVLSHGKEDLDVSILKNGAAIARAGAMSTSFTYDQGSVTIVTQLNIGDEVWVAHYNSYPQTIYGNSYTSFMGCLVVPL